MGASSPGNSITGIVEETSGESSPQKRCTTPVTVTHFTDRGKIEKVSELSIFNNENNLNSLTSFTSDSSIQPIKENNNNPFVGNNTSTTTITNPFHTETSNNPFLNPLIDDEVEALKEELNGNIDSNEEENTETNAIDKNEIKLEIMTEKTKVCQSYCMLHDHCVIFQKDLGNMKRLVI